MNKKWPIALMLMIVLIVFTAQNYEVATIKFLFWSFKTSRALVLFITLLAGMLIGWALSISSKNK